jgi:uncharacterized phage protein gp47/JayE
VANDNVRLLNWQEILDQMLSLLPPQWRANFTGKILRRLMVAFALVMEALYGLLAKVLRLAIVATSEGETLRQLVAGFGMTTYGGIASVAWVQFERWGDASNPVTIPAGTIVQTDNGLNFAVLAETTLQAGQAFVLVQCQCQRPGAAGNVGAQRIIALRSPLAGIDAVSNPDPAVGGADPEGDLAIKQRVPQHLAMLHRATIPATEAAILSQQDLFPEVVAFVTERRVGLPGYVRGTLADASGGQVFRPGTWQTDTLGQWCPVAMPVYGLIEVGWPCKRFGDVARGQDGAETWNPSPSAVDVSQGTYRWHYDPTLGRLYARANGQDLNTLDLVLYAGVVWRAVRELETRWVAAGVGVDIVVPRPVRVPVSLSYALAPGYDSTTVETGLQNAVVDYLSNLAMGQSATLSGLYQAIAPVRGTTEALITAPEEAVTVLNTEIIRPGIVTVEREG